MSATSFKATCLEVMDEVARTGRTVIVTKHGRPVVAVTALPDAVSSPWGFMKDSIGRIGDIVSPMPDAWAMSDSDPLARARKSPSRKAR
jgi:prevent-host-death family protein